MCWGKVMRVVPRANEDVNETWIADRDRYSYEGIYSEDRLSKPLIREGETWREVDWETALNRAAEKLSAVARQNVSQVGALVAPTSTLEEAYLTQRLVWPRQQQRRSSTESRRLHRISS
jgi:NADH-quinone oxidoreductase subunit G